MCGIFACLHCSRGPQGGICFKEALVKKLQRRGPDYIREVCIPISKADLQLNVLGTLLCMRGEPTLQPLGNEAGDWFLWNGNAFGGSIQISPEENDTAKVFEELGSVHTPTELLNVMSSVHGPWSFVFWQASTQSLWFGRDVFGRRSLLWHLPQATEGDDCLAISSVGYYDPTSTPVGYWLEVPAVGIFQLNCKDIVNMQSASLLCYLWMQGDHTFQSEGEIAEELSSLETCISISTVRETNPRVSFPSLNTSTDVGSCFSSATSTQGGAKQLDTPMDYMSEPTLSSEKLPLLSPSTTKPSMTSYSDHVFGLLDVLQSAVQCRVARAPPVFHREAVTEPAKNLAAMGEVTEEEVGGSNSDCGTLRGCARVAVLFSGGVDSAVLAALTDRCMEHTAEIDLINVAFEQTHLPENNPTRFDVPDRLSGLACLQELNPKRKWNFIMVNVTLEEVNKMRREHISQLVYPLNTVLDDSIGCALWFAARGEGLLYHTDPTQCRKYCSSARTLLIGIGADEQLAGYSRHRTKFRSSGLAGIIQEVEMDIKRLAKRNFGRDDRCTADHQRDAQYPFLDERVVAYLQALPMTLKVTTPPQGKGSGTWDEAIAEHAQNDLPSADLSQPRGVGEKRLLRDVAATLHCHTAAALPKRAIQFGSRMAKLAGSSNNHEHGRDICDRLFSGSH